MFLPGRSTWWILLIHLASACCLEISGIYKDEVLCSQGLSQCTMKKEMPSPVPENNAVYVQKLTPHFKLCCKQNEFCALCLVIDTELHVRLDEETDDEGSGPDEEDYRDETKNTKAAVTMCYKPPSTLPTCKKVKFLVNRAAFTQQNSAKMSMVIMKPAGVFFSSEISVFPSKSPNLSQQVVAPSEVEVCALKKEHVVECLDKRKIPRVNVFHQEKNWVELQFSGKNKSLPSVCIQYEQSGACQIWNKTRVPLYSVTPCMCLQVWGGDEWSGRHVKCPFKNTEATINASLRKLIERNVWKNMSVSVGYGQMNNYNTMLWWKLSAPCKLDGEVWPCHQEHRCREQKGFRQQLENGTWTQNSQGFWEKQGVFENVTLQLSSCIMVKLKGMGHELGPFCLNNTDRYHWSLLLVGVMLLVCFTWLVFYLCNVSVKKWLRSCHHGGFVNIGRTGHVVLLSPPDVDDGVSESVCGLGSLLCDRGFGVSVDQWSRKEQCTLGPLPWLHSQLLELNSLGGRVVMVLTHKALEKTAEWVHQHPSDTGLPLTWSPYSDVFTACLCLIEAEKRLGRAGERFVLVKFDSHPSGDETLPDVLRGLPVFQLPSQLQPLLSELAARRTGRRLAGRTWKWDLSPAWRANKGNRPADAMIM